MFCVCVQSLQLVHMVESWQSGKQGGAQKNQCYTNAFHLNSKRKYTQYSSQLFQHHLQSIKLMTVAEASQGLFRLHVH